MKKVNIIMLILIVLVAFFLIKQKSFSGAVVPASVCIKSDVSNPHLIDSWMNQASWITLDVFDHGTLEKYTRSGTTFNPSNSCNNGVVTFTTISGESENGFTGDIYVTHLSSNNQFIHVCRNYVTGGSSGVMFLWPQNDSDQTFCGASPTPTPTDNYPSDLNGDGSISFSELLTYGGRWALGTIGRQDVVNAITAWSLQ